MQYLPQSHKNSQWDIKMEHGTLFWHKNSIFEDLVRSVMVPVRFDNFSPEYHSGRKCCCLQESLLRGPVLSFLRYKEGQYPSTSQHYSQGVDYLAYLTHIVHTITKYRKKVISWSCQVSWHFPTLLLLVVNNKLKEKHIHVLVDFANTWVKNIFLSPQ